MPIQTLAWDNDALVIIDQSLLPDRSHLLRLTTAGEVRECIRSLKVRGAPAIGLAAAFGLYLGVRDWPVSDAAGFWDELVRVKADLAGARPTAVNLAWALARLYERAEASRSAGVAAVKAALLSEALALVQADNAVCRAIGRHGLELLRDGMTVLTHCNAGGLGTAQYGTALAPLYLAQEQGWRISVFADETRPVLQGARLTAWELMQAGIQVTLICDSAAAWVMAQHRVDAVLVGADRVARNGDVANKIGTYGLAVLAREHGIPFYVALPRSTIDWRITSGDQIPIEERPAHEVTDAFGRRTAPAGVAVYNPAFDVTPAAYVSAFVTEAGIVRPPYLSGLTQIREAVLA